MILSQKAGVYNAIKMLLAETDRTIESGVKVELTTSERKSIVLALCEATSEGILERKSNKSNQPLPKYWEQTLSNWLRKDDRLNGKPGEKYEAANPGSRSGVGDAELKELKKLLVQVIATGVEANIAAVQKHVDARLAVVEAEKAQKLKVDLSKIDPELLKSIGFVQTVDEVFSNGANPENLKVFAESETDADEADAEDDISDEAIAAQLDAEDAADAEISAS